MANVAKMYVYSPTFEHKQEMKRGLVGLNGHQERPELNKHYEATKKSFSTSISFCACCSKGACPLNRYPVHMIVAAAELIDLCNGLPGTAVINKGSVPKLKFKN